MSKDQDSRDESVQLLDGADESPGKSQDMLDLVDVEIITNHRGSVVVEYQVDGIPYRSSVDPLDLVDGQCPRERLRDAPYGIDWKFDIADIARETELALKAAQIWTYTDLQEKDRQLIRIATNILGRAIWSAAKSGRNRRQQ